MQQRSEVYEGCSGMIRNKPFHLEVLRNSSLRESNQAANNLYLPYREVFDICICYIYYECHHKWYSHYHHYGGL